MSLCFFFFSIEGRHVLDLSFLSILGLKREIERHRERFLLFNWKHVLDLSFLSILGLKRDIEIRERDRKGLPPHIKMQNLTHDLLLGPAPCSCLILASVVLYINREHIESNTWIANNHHFRHYKKKASNLNCLIGPTRCSFSGYIKIP